LYRLATAGFARFREQVNSNDRRHPPKRGLEVDPVAIRAKFGDDYTATESTFRLGIDIRLTRAMAERFAGMRVLETCTGAGFTTIALAEVAAHVTTVEIDPEHQAQAHQRTAAQLLAKVDFIWVMPPDRFWISPLRPMLRSSILTGR
jgi:hypothetical protein